MKKINKLFLMIVGIIGLVSCGNSGSSSESTSFSGLTGTYTNDVAIKKDNKGNDLRIYNNLTEAVDGNMYTSNAYPLNTVNGSKVCYAYVQSLKLKRDFTYEYEYTITLTNSEEWGKDFAIINVDLGGTFTYTSQNEESYRVTLSNPTKGSLDIRGATITMTQNIFAWNLNNTSSYHIDIEHELMMFENYSYHRLIQGRIVEVIRNGDDRVLNDNIYYYDIMNDVAPYCDYTC